MSMSLLKMRVSLPTQAQMFCRALATKSVTQSHPPRARGAFAKRAADPTVPLIDPNINAPGKKYPPWIFTKQELKEKSWMGRKLNQKEYAEKRMSKAVTNADIDSWDTWFHDRRKVSTRGANDLMRVFSLRGEHEKALEVFDEMRERGLEHDAFSYNIAIASATNLEQYSTSQKLFREMREAGIEDEGCAPYTSLMRSYMRAGHLDFALSMVEKARLEGVEPDKVMLTNVIVIAGLRQDLNAAEDALQELKSTGQYPDIVAYNAMLRACSKTKAGYKALDILQEMRQFGIPLDIHSYNSAIKALVECGMSDDAKKLFDDMIAQKERAEVMEGLVDNATKEGLLPSGLAEEVATEGERELSIAPTVETFTILMQYYAARAEFEACEQMMQLMRHDHHIQPDERVYGTLIDACYFAAGVAHEMPARVEWAKKAEGILAEALEDVTELHAEPLELERLLTRVLKVWTFTDDFEGAAEFCKRYEALGVEKSPRAFAALLNMHERAADGPGAAKVLQEMASKGLSPSASFVCRVALAFTRGFKPDTALQILGKAQEAGVQLKQCREFRWLPDALGKEWRLPNDWVYPPGRVVTKQDFEDFRNKLLLIVGDAPMLAPPPSPPNPHKRKGPAQKPKRTGRRS